MWSVGGLLLALALAAVAWRRSVRPGGYYDSDVYAMTQRSHRRYAAMSAGFAALFAIAVAFRREAVGIAGLALYAIVAVWYGASFLRGASDDDD